jgi:hypothetical protein
LIVPSKDSAIAFARKAIYAFWCSIFKVKKNKIRTVVSF